MKAFEKFLKETCLPAECDDERVMVGMRMCWQDAMLHAAEIAENTVIPDYADGNKVLSDAIRKETEEP